MSSLSERAVLTVLRIGGWTGMAVDSEVTEDTAERYKADTQDAGTYTKRLVAKRFLDPVNRAARLASRTHKTLTSPWEDGGPRILSTNGLFAYQEQMRLRRLDYQAKANEFAANLDEYIKDAKPRLGNMFDAENYPTAAEVKKKFWFDVEIKGVPEAGDFRAELSKASVDAIVKDIERRSEERLTNAMNDVFNRVLKVTGHMVERLKAYEPPTGRAKGEKGNDFHGSTVSNIAELAEILPALNLTNDPRLAALQQQLLDELVTNSPEVLKSDPKVRSETQRKAEKIYNKVKGFLA